MKLIYNPSFSGNAYVNLEKLPVLLDTQVVNTAGLINIIKLHAGICSEVKDYGTRFVNYYAAMKQYMSENPENALAESFSVDKLNTSKKCLEWRDTLAAAGWTKKSPSPTKRMKVLSGVEKYFEDKSFGQDLLDVIFQIESGCTLPELEIETSFYCKDYNPAEVRLLEALKKRGISVSLIDHESDKTNISKIYSALNGEEGIKLNTKDNSFEIWNFKNKDEAIKYLTLLESDDFDIWINSDNKEFDNWQKLEGKKLSGSVSTGIPQIAQLLNIGLTIFERPLNVYNIVEWLNVSLSPLSKGFRKNLAENICSSGGYYNKTCENYINSYIEKYPDTEEKIKTFLPDISKPYFKESEIKVKEIKTFVESLRNWCKGKLAMNETGDEAVNQLGFIVSQANTLLLLLDEMGTNTIPYSDIELMNSVFSTEQTLQQYAAQAGCKNVINSYSDICDDVEDVIWCDFYQCGNAGKLTYSFLSPAEEKTFGESLELWESDKERSYIRNLLLTPFAKTRNKLVLVTIDKIGSADAPKSPAFIQLEKYFQDESDPKNKSKNQLYKFVKQMELDGDLYKKVSKVDNRMDSNQEFVEIEDTDYIKDNWPDHQSYSTLENLIPHPLDYVIDKFVGFSGNDVDALGDISTTTGLVAHKIIEILFGPVESEKSSGTPKYIRKQIDERFEEVFEETVQSKGAILLIKENKQELQKFKKQMKECLEQLLKGIEENGLKVVACEKKIGYSKNKEKVLSHGKIGCLDIKGEVDMLLADDKGNPYIFDFKWTSSAHRHADMLKENKSVQLALYRELIEKEMKADVKAVAYFLMPAAKFVSTSELKGAINLQQVLPEEGRRTKDLLKEIQNSYKYRMSEIFDGKLEETSGWAKEDITYEQNAEAEGLMPMDYYEGAKNGPYNSIGLIKGRK